MSKQTSFPPFKFPAFKEVCDHHFKTFSSEASQWRKIGEGLNFEGVCKNKLCVAHGKKVWAILGYGDFSLPFQLYNTLCPICKKKTRDVLGVGLYQAELIGKGKKVVVDRSSEDTEDEDEEDDKFLVLSKTKNGFLKFGDVEKQIILWHYLNLSVKKIPLCPAQHQLNETKVSDKKGSCKKCWKKFEENEIRKNCQKCNYQICKFC